MRRLPLAALPHPAHPPKRLLASLLATALLLPACGPQDSPSSGSAPNTDTVVETGPSLLRFIAGDMGGQGNADGTGTAASFDSPLSVAVDADGNAYVASGSAIRKITPDGVVSTLAGGMATGSSDGTGASASFYMPKGVAVDSAGNVYVADHYNRTVRKVTPAGVVTTLAGTAGVIGNADGTGAAASFSDLNGITVDGQGNVYVADNYVVRKITPDGVVSTLAGAPANQSQVDGTGSAAGFGYMVGIVADPDGNLFVVDAGTIRKVTQSGVVTTIAGRANWREHVDGTGTDARFYEPYGIGIDANRNLYVTELSHTIRKVTPEGVVTSVAGTSTVSGHSDGTGTNASFNEPQGVAADASGNLYVADTSNHEIRKVSAAGVVTTLAGSPAITGSADGTGAAASFNGPYGVAGQAGGVLYVADTSNHRIRKVTASGEVSTYTGLTSGSTDGTLDQARFRYPTGMQLDGSNNLFVLDQSGHALRKISANGVVSTVVSSNSYSFNGGCALALDSAGNAFVSDASANALLKVTPAGVVSTLAGTPPSSGDSAPVRAASVRPASASPSSFADGTGPAAQFNSPCGVAADNAGNVYVADTGNHAIRKVTSDGVVTTIAGDPSTSGYGDGTGAAARFSQPASMVISSTGNLYVADGNLIRKVTPAGVATTLAGQANVYGWQAGTLPGVLRWNTTLSIVGNALYLTSANGVAKISPLP